MQFIRRAKAPELPVILLEDFAALIGLTFALLGVGLTLLTKEPIFDVIGTGLIGVLLVVVAVVLAMETKSLLLGEAASPEAQRRIQDAIEGTEGIDERDPHEDPAPRPRGAPGRRQDRRDRLRLGRRASPGPSTPRRWPSARPSPTARGDLPRARPAPRDDATRPGWLGGATPSHTLGVAPFARDRGQTLPHPSLRADP